MFGGYELEPEEVEFFQGAISGALTGQVMACRVFHDGEPTIAIVSVIETPAGVGIKPIFIAVDNEMFGHLSPSAPGDEDFVDAVLTDEDIVRLLNAPNN